MGKTEADNLEELAGQCQGLIDAMEEDTPHDELPPYYDWLVQTRDRLRRMLDDAV